MQLPLVLGFLAASAAATPVRNAAVSKMKWSPAAGTTATCDKATDKWISTTVGPEQGSDLLDHACAALMPACAYQENHEGLICAQTIDFAIDGTKTVQLNATVETEETLGKTTAWAANFTVTPVPQPEGQPAVSWTKGDCVGYLDQLLSQTAPAGCLIEGSGPGAGNVTVGGTASLKGTVIGISFVERQ